MMTPTFDPQEPQDDASREGWTALLDAMPQGVMLVDSKGRYLEVNPAAADILGMDRETLLASGLASHQARMLSLDGKVISPDDIPGVLVLKNGKSVPKKIIGWVREDGGTLWLEFSANPLPGGSVMVCFDDLTDLHVQSCKLERLTQLYAALSQVNQAIVWSPTREDLLDKICEVMVNFGKFNMAWIGWNDSERHEVRVVSHYGDKTGYLDNPQVRSDDTPLGRGGTGNAIREGRVCVMNDLLGSDDMSPWHDAALYAGFAASVSLPIRSGGKVCGALVVYASEKNFFGAQELSLLEEAAGDLTFALENHEHEAKRKQMEEALKESEYFFRESQRTAAIGSYNTDFTQGMWKSSEVLDTIFGIGGDYHRSVQGWLDLVHPADRIMLDQYLREEVIAKKLPFSKEYRIIRKNTGETRWVNGLGEVQFAADGAVISLTGTIQDITERKQVEDHLLESQARLQRAERVANFGHWQLHMDEQVVFASDGARVIYGLTGVEWPIQTVRELPIPEHRPILEAALANLVDHQQPYNVEFRIMRTIDGEMREIHSIAEYDPCRRVIFGVIHDITERKQAENALYLEKTFTRALLDNQIEGVVACDENGELVLFNRTLAKWQGMDALKLPKEQWAEHYDLFEADGKTPLATNAIPLVRAFNGEVIHDVGLVICAKNQPPRHVLCTGSPILDETNQKLGAVVVMHDISQQRKDEELLRNTLQRLKLATASASMGVWDWDLQSGSMTWDHRMFELYGATHGEIRGTVQDWKDGLYPEDLDRAISECEAAIRGDVPFDTEFRVKHRNGAILWIHANATVLRDEIGRPLRMIGLNRDITERKETEARLRESEDEVRSVNQNLEQRVKERTAQLEAANKEMEAFSYSVSHDLRAPLRSIDGFSKVLLEDYSNQVDEEGRHYLSRIRMGAQRMGLLIDDLLKLSKTSRSELTVSDCNLSRLCSQVAGNLADLHTERRVAVSIQPGMLVQADHHLMQVVLENLLGNAWKFTLKSEVPRIELGETVSTQGERTFFIRDNGAGFDMANAGKLFNAFQRLHATTDFEGTGIGLAIVHRIIHRHGGRVWAEAKPGEGATFFFTLPRTQSDGKAG